MSNRYFLILKGTNKDFAEFEFCDLFRVFFGENISLNRISNVFYEFNSNVLLDFDVTEHKEFLERLTFTKHVSLVLFEGDWSKFVNGVSDLGISDYEGKSFCVNARRIKKKFTLPMSLDMLAKPIFYEFDNPKVDLKNFGVQFNFFYRDVSEFFFTKTIFKNDMEYLDRMPKFRPVVMPYTLKSDMARGAINILGLRNGIILDPFCGIGGILLEAYDMGFEIVGNDISWNDLKFFKQNFDYYYPNSKYVRVLADSATQFLKPESVDGIVSDIPYGKSCRRLGTDLYENFLKAANVYLKSGGRLVLIYANFLEFRDIALKYFNEVIEIDHYINKSMTRHILVLEKK